MSQSKEIRVCIDVGSVNHYVAIGLSTGERIEEFHLSHNQEGIDQFFYRLEKLQNKYQLPISVAMESYNGYARPIDSMVLDKGYKLLNVNNLKLARFKEIFPGPAKSDPIDAWMMFDLFNMGDRLPMAKNILQEVGEIPEVNKKLKFLTRRRDVLVIEKASIANRLQGDLLAIAPGILSITKSISNRWFLNFLTAKEDIRQLSRMQRKTILKVKGVGKNYADSVQKWQKSAIFSPDVSWMIGTIYLDARRLLELIEETERLEKIIDELIPESKIASLIKTIGGFGTICSAVLAGEIGTQDRFKSEASLALYIGMAVLDNKSGKYNGTRNPRNINKRAKRAMMIGVDRHRKTSEESKKYFEKKRINDGKKHNQAIRALGRFMVRVIWSMLKQNRSYQLRGNQEPTIIDNSKEDSVKISKEAFETINQKVFEENKIVA